MIIDQVVKIYIKTHFSLRESVDVFSWFKIHFIENPGAAWGFELSEILPISPKTGKIILTLFRLVAIVGIGYWLNDSIKKKAPNVLILCVALIFAGALGNILDSVFYGAIFTSSEGQLATAFSGDAYGQLFYGNVVDMLYFPLITDAHIPEWVPFWGGSTFSFFEPVFNIADSAISVGVFILLIFSKKAFPKKAKEETVDVDEVAYPVEGDVSEEIAQSEVSPTEKEGASATITIDTETETPPKSQEI